MADVGPPRGGVGAIPGTRVGCARRRPIPRPRLRPVWGI